MFRQFESLVLHLGMCFQNFLPCEKRNQVKRWWEELSYGAMVRVNVGSNKRTSIFEVRPSPMHARACHMFCSFL